MTFSYDISLATPDDIPGILTVQEPNLPDHGGSLSVRQTADWFRKAHVRIIQTMLRAFPPPHDCYLYGPVCIAENERGNGLAAALFKVLQTHMDGRPLMTFVRADNAPSLRAHHKMGMRDLGAFTNEGVAYIALAYDQPSEVDIHSK